MPTYAYRCDEGHLTEQWLSIHADEAERLRRCGTCRGPVSLSIEAVHTYAVGERGKHTAISDATDREWHRDMDAYKRFHDAGIQPQRITGCDKMEAKYISRSQVESGGALPYSDERIAAGTEEARQIMREAATP